MNIIDYLIPANIIAKIIVLAIITIAIYWFNKFFEQRTRMMLIQNDIERVKDIAALKKSQTEIICAKTNDTQWIENEFTRYCASKELPGDSPIANHIKIIFSAGCNESRLSADELIEHTTNKIFKQNNMLRNVLNTFIIIGLLGTLIGLAESLAKLNLGSIYNQDANMGIASTLGGLLKSLKGAFAPSIWGVFLTILGVFSYSYYLHKYCDPLKNELDYATLSIWLPQLYPNTSQRLEETLRFSEEQMHKNFEAAKKVAEFAEGFQGKLDEFNQKLSSATETLGTIHSATQQMDGAAKLFSDSIANLASFQTELKSIYQQIAGESDLFQRNVEESIKKSATFEENSKKVFDEQNEQIQTLLKAFHAYEDAYICERQKIDESIHGVLDAAKSSFEAASAKEKEFEDKVGRPLVTALETNLENISKNLLDGLDQIQREFIKFDAPINQAASEISGTLGAVVSRTERIANELQNSYLSSIEKMDQRLESRFEALGMQRPVRNTAQEGNNDSLVSGDVADLNRNIKELTMTIAKVGRIKKEKKSLFNKLFAKKSG